MYELPESIKNIIGSRSFNVDTIGMSDAQVICFDDMVLKIEPYNEESDNEYHMMDWLSDKLPVPNILCSEKVNGISYLLMSRIKGDMLCTPELQTDPELLVKLLAEGLHMLWNVNIANCPYDNTLDHKLRLAKARVSEKLCNIEDAEPGTYSCNGFQSPEHLLEWLLDNKPVEEPVFSHGDYCLPNIFIYKNKINGFIDLGRSGVADKYQDIALCYRSLLHNLNGKYSMNKKTEYDCNMLFEELQIEPNWEKIRYYILLDELF
ncbi:APH(3') family aminoglycoside O-phosphotransferase [Anaeromicropila herbilytica]|uniref:Aminoglycoside O-phosphotransferase APH(3')-IIIa n=1 Tax=Anaeromicropila herbilytica TaxID=2785025 RepID=A0A7R7EL00_9FIRM|nr:APH(3') family aminoglycoside O-phosphotransferase [Anaeromicropila herbilytica]BCN30821.1 aminoglycoside O-phosphotransferase APH(3')-IIIa [Anaeromicropila herbilytica]